MSNTALPPGQRERPDFPRFGLIRYAFRLDRITPGFALHIGGMVPESVAIREADLHELERVEVIRDFHCVTNWSTRGNRWGGWRERNVGFGCRVGCCVTSTGRSSDPR